MVRLNIIQALMDRFCKGILCENIRVGKAMYGLAE